MDIEKAICELKENIEMPFGSDISEETSKMAIEALEELQRYRYVGTVDEFRAAMEKQTPKEPIMKPYDDLEDEYLCCPNCGEILTDRIPFEPKTFYFHCLNCGQKFKWGD